MILGRGTLGALAKAASRSSGTAAPPALRLPAGGDWAEVDRLWGPADTAGFAELSWDSNPLHLDAAFAATTRFKRPIVHGMLCASLFSALFASRLPGSVYMRQAHLAIHCRTLTAMTHQHELHRVTYGKLRPIKF